MTMTEGPSTEELKGMMPNKAMLMIGTATACPTPLEMEAALVKLAANAKTIPSKRGDGLLGHLFLVVGPGSLLISKTSIVRRQQRS
jgi:hypothetical protein